MRIIFVRHGEPDYEHDCLTPEGHRQAAAAAERLARENISRIYASPQGRAQQTALYTARRLNLPIVTLDYMHEISWGGPGIPFGGHPWTLGDRMIDEEDCDFHAGDWRAHPCFAENIATRCYEEVSARFDGFLADQGYRREGGRYRCESGTDRTVALFSHGGSGGCALAHTLGLPFPYVASALPFEFASVTMLDFPVREGEFVHPRLALFNDCAHLSAHARAPLIQAHPDAAP